jgi:hypothetical protein
MTDRYEQFSKFPIKWPVIDAGFIAAAMRWAIVIVALAGAIWLIGVVRQNRGRNIAQRNKN